MSVSAEVWGTISRVIALVAIPHAAALCLAKLLSIPAIPKLGTLAKICEAAAYATLAATSAVVIHAFMQPLPPDVTAADVERARDGITLGVALSLYAVIFCCSTLFFGSAVTAVKMSLNTRNAVRFKWALGALAFLSFMAWFPVLLLIVRANPGLSIPNGFAMVAVAVGPPGLVLVAVLMARVFSPEQPSR